jgi:hypothetical protein
VTPDERAALRAQWLQDIEAEIERRRAARIVASAVSKDVLFAKLSEMSKNLRSAPGWKEPTPAQSRRATRDIERWFRRHGYGLDPLAG